MHKRLRLPCFFAFAAFIFFTFADISESAVTLRPRANSSNAIAGGEDYILFGRYRHASLDASSRYRQEAKPTPVLWRVMEIDSTTNPARAILLSHYLLDVMAYCGKIRESSPNSGKWVRNDTTVPANQWGGAEIQAWLGSSAMANVTQHIDGKGTTRSIKGFLHPDYYATQEKAALLPYPGEARNGVTLPSLLAGGYEGNWYDWKYGGELAGWFGANDYDGNVTYGPNSLARRAHFKGASFAYGSAGSFGWPYWTRSPVAGTTRFSCFVDADGTLGRNDVRYGHVAVRPTLSLNLGFLIFKSASDAFDPSILGFTPSGQAGEKTNPFLLYATTGALSPRSVVANGASLAIKFDRRVAHAYAGTKSEKTLGGLFVVKKGVQLIAIDKAVVNGDAVILILHTPINPGDTGITVEYAYAANHTDGIGFLDDARGNLPTVWKGLGASAVSVINDTK